MKVETSTFLPASVKHFHVLQVDAQTTSHCDGVAGIVLESASDGTVGVSSATDSTVRNSDIISIIVAVI